MTCTPILGQRELEFSGVLAQVGVGADEPFINLKSLSRYANLNSPEICRRLLS